MRLDPDEAYRRFARQRVARLATADGHGRPHLVPITFATPDERTVLTAVDHKPKTTTALVRLRNIEQNPQVSVLTDRYDEDWDLLWWARADGRATVRAQADLTALTAKYEQYRGRTPAGPVIVIEVERWSGWAAAAT